MVDPLIGRHGGRVSLGALVLGGNQGPPFDLNGKYTSDGNSFDTIADAFSSEVLLGRCQRSSVADLQSHMKSRSSAIFLD